MYVDGVRLNNSGYEALDELLNIMEKEEDDDEQDNEEGRSLMESNQEEAKIPNSDYTQKMPMMWTVLYSLY